MFGLEDTSSYIFVDREQWQVEIVPTGDALVADDYYLNAVGRWSRNDNRKHTQATHDMTWVRLVQKVQR